MKTRFNIEFEATSAVYMRRFICELFGCHNKPKIHLGFTIDPPQPKNPLHTMPLELSITNEQKVNVRLSPVTDTGKPAKLDGTPVWSVVSGDATFEAAPDGLSAFLVSSDTPGDTIFMVDADGDVGEGVVDIQDTITLHTTGANAANLGLIADAPVPK